jgi:hypothetical protein
VIFYSVAVGFDRELCQLPTRIAARKRFVVRADEKLTAFLELERAICIHLLSQQIKS